MRQFETGLKCSWIIVESERSEEVQIIPECIHAWHNLWGYCIVLCCVVLRCVALRCVVYCIVFFCIVLYYCISTLPLQLRADINGGPET